MAKKVNIETLLSKSLKLEKVWHALKEVDEDDLTLKERVVNDIAKIKAWNAYYEAHNLYEKEINKFANCEGCDD